LSIPILDIFAKTDVGRVRTGNEDNFIVTSSLGSDNWVVPQEQFSLPDAGCAFIVADGMGGASAGEVASELAVQGIKLYLNEQLSTDTTDSDIIPILEESLIISHKMIVKYGVDNPESFGLGTTATICFVRGKKLYISWIGDSRVYRYNKAGRVTTNKFNVGHLEILTDDHSMVWEEVLKGKLTPEQARTAPHSNIILQSLGDPSKTPKPQTKVYPYYQGDIILSCSDGLNGELSDSSIKDLIEGESDMDVLVDKLIQEANKAGGKDNITLAICKVVEGPTYTAPVDDDRNVSSEQPDNFKERSLLLPVGIILVSALLAFGIRHFWNDYQSSNKFSQADVPKINEKQDDVRIVDSLVLETKKDSISEDTAQATFVKVVQPAPPQKRVKNKPKSKHQSRPTSNSSKTSTPTTTFTQSSSKTPEEVEDHYVDIDEIKKSQSESNQPLYIGEEPEIRDLLNKIADKVMNDDPNFERHRQKWREFNNKCNTEIKVENVDAREAMIQTLKRMYDTVSK